MCQLADMCHAGIRHLEESLSCIPAMDFLGPDGSSPFRLDTPAEDM